MAPPQKYLPHFQNGGTTLQHPGRTHLPSWVRPGSDRLRLEHTASSGTARHNGACPTSLEGHHRWVLPHRGHRARPRSLLFPQHGDPGDSSPVPPSTGPGIGPWGRMGIPPQGRNHQKSSPRSPRQNHWQSSHQQRD